MVGKSSGGGVGGAGSGVGGTLVRGKPLGAVVGGGGVGLALGGARLRVASESSLGW